MADDVIKLFDTDANETILPFESQDNKDSKDNTDKEIKIADGSELKSEGIQKAISGEQVKTLMIPMESSIIQPNYLIDLKSSKGALDFHGHILDTFLDDDGDTAIYIITKSGAIVRLGFGLAEKLDRLLCSSVRALYSGECKVYKNIEQGKGLNEVKSRDPSTIRLRL